MAQAGTQSCEVRSHAMYLCSIHACCRTMYLLEAKPCASVVVVDTCAKRALQAHMLHRARSFAKRLPHIVAQGGSITHVRSLVGGDVAALTLASNAMD